MGPPGETVQFGYIKSLTKKGSSYELRFDPAVFLSGETANVAAAEDEAVEPGEPVPNDHYVVDEGHRLFTYRVPPGAKLTVVVAGPKNIPITVAELATDRRRRADGALVAARERLLAALRIPTRSSRSTSSTGPRMARGLLPALGLAASDPVRRSLDRRDRLVPATDATRRRDVRPRWRSARNSGSGPARRRPPPAARRSCRRGRTRAPRPAS